MTDKQEKPVNGPYFYTCVVPFLMLYIIDWILGHQDEMLSLSWIVLSIIIFCFSLFYLKNIKKYPRKFLLSCVLISLFFLGQNFDSEIKKYTLGKIVFYMNAFYVFSEAKFIIRERNGTLTARKIYSSISGSRSQKYDVHIEGKKLLFKSLHSNYTFDCSRDFCDSTAETERFHIWIDQLLYFTPDRG